MTRGSSIHLEPWVGGHFLLLHSKRTLAGVDDDCRVVKMATGFYSLPAILTGKAVVWDRGRTALLIFQHLQLWSINIWQRLRRHLPCAAAYMLTCVSEIPITLYWIVKPLFRLCFLHMLRARWLSLDSRGKWPRIAMVIYQSVETGSSSCYFGNEQRVGGVCVR